MQFGQYTFDILVILLPLEATPRKSSVCGDCSATSEDHAPSNDPPFK